GTGADTLLVTGAGDLTWNITGTDAGHVGAVSFSGVENLTGDAGNEDTFVVAHGADQSGSLAGVADGGAGGFDTLVFEGDYGTVVYSASGPDAGTVSLDGTVLTYRGMEPITNKGTAASVIFSGTAGVDQIVLEKDPNFSGNLRIRSEN